MISEPTLLLDEEICKKNIHEMASKANEHGLKFKPHMKTHQSHEIGEWLRDASAEAITVSSIKMGRYFAKAGWQDITIAFPVNIKQAKAINELAKIVDLTLLVNNRRAARILGESLTTSVKVYIEIDTGSGRSGLAVDQKEDIDSLLEILQHTEHLNWIGFYSHPGHSYSARSRDEIRKIHDAVLDEFRDLRNAFKPSLGDFEICIGDTPCCSVANNFEGVDAISPGNFVFFDLMQVQIGSCDISDIAVAVSCPIVDIYPERKEMIVHGGAVHFSKESIKTPDFAHFGLAVNRHGNKWHKVNPELYLTSLSQEHGTVSTETASVADYDIGDTMTFLPVHSCLTTNLIGRYTSTSGRNISMMPR